MNVHRKIIAAITSITLGVAGLAVATPANATRATLTFANCTDGTLNGQSFNVPSGATSLTIDFTTCPTTSPRQLAIATAANPASNSTRANFAGSLDLFVISANGPNPLDDYRIATTGPPSVIPGGSYQVFYAWYANSAAAATNTGSFTIVVGSGGGGGSSSSAAAEPQTVEISLTPEDGTTCRNSSQPGTAGTWINLPGADDCTPPASKAGATLLGWATSPNFPVEIAKRQVVNGWGAYETFNDDGQLTGVFIPAGGATLLSSAGKLYTIWSE